MENSDFLLFDEHLQKFIWFIVSFDYNTAKEIWPEKDFNYLEENHFWNKFLECDRNPVFFYSRLDPVNRKKLYRYIMNKKY